MTFQKHAIYRRSGIEWLTDVPIHWPRPKKLGEISSLKGRLGWQGLKADEYRDDGPFVVSSAHFSNFRIDWDGCPRVSRERYELDDNIQLSEGDILLMKDGAALGKLAFVDHLPGDACLNSHLLLFRPIPDGGELTYWPKFAFYYFQTNYFQEYMQTRGTGATFLGVSQEAISRHVVVWPCYAEQKIIASYLDIETVKIDTLVEEQKRLIELLKEKRQAVISQAVTKGLDPNVPMKDSGVEWLGQVPTQWKVTPLKLVAQFRSGGTPDKSRLDYWDGGIPWASAKDLKFDELADTADHITEAALAAGAATLIDSNVVLVVVRGMILARTFPVAIAKVGMAINQDLKAVSMRMPGSNEWLAWVLRASTVETLSRLDEAGHGTKALRMDAWGGMRIALPSPEEQERIASYLAGECARIDELVHEAEQAMNLLNERRSALVSAAVTGKIDVRGLAPQPEPTAA